MISIFVKPKCKGQAVFDRLGRHYSDKPTSVDKTTYVTRLINEGSLVVCVIATEDRKEDDNDASSAK